MEDFYGATWMKARLCRTLLVLLCLSSGVCHGWTVAPLSLGSVRSSGPRITSLVAGHHEDRHQACLTLSAKGKRQSRSTKGDPYAALLEEEEKPAGIEGAQFFGGNKEKEEFFDPVAEAQAGLDDTGLEGSGEDDDAVQVYDRFQCKEAFPDSDVAALSRRLQLQINSVLYEEGQGKDGSDPVVFTNNLVWETPFQVKMRSPLEELEAALDFYRRIDVAVTSGERVSSNVICIRWEISLAWPTFWEPRVLLTGQSKLTFESDATVVRQVDTLDSDLMSTIVSQVVPRFWDVYHIGMTPSAEISPKLRTNENKSLFSPYQLHELPPRLMVRPTLLDLGGREDGNAGAIPNHSFACVIKTMGPQRQRYVPASPLEVQIIPRASGPLKLKWNIPIAVEFASNIELPLPGPNPEANDKSQPECGYSWQHRRLVATTPYGGGPQDSEVADVRKQLYEQVVKDGHAPKLDGSGRPNFFFWDNSAKACYTEEGLGMAVYEWRPRASKPNEIGIELELRE